MSTSPERKKEIIKKRYIHNSGCKVVSKGKGCFRDRQERITIFEFQNVYNGIQKVFFLDSCAILNLFTEVSS